MMQKESLPQNQSSAQTESSLVLKNRELLTLTGVSEVISYHEGEVLIKTDLGTLRILGQNLQLGDLSVAKKNCLISGQINGMIYEKPIAEQNKKFFARIFG